MHCNINRLLNPIIFLIDKKKCFSNMAWLVCYSGVYSPDLYIKLFQNRYLISLDDKFLHGVYHIILSKTSVRRISPFQYFTPAFAQAGLLGSTPGWCHLDIVIVPEIKVHIKIGSIYRYS